LAPQAFFFGTNAVFLAFEAARRDFLRDLRVAGQKTPPQMASGALLSPGAADQIQSRPAIPAFPWLFAVPLRFFGPPIAFIDKPASKTPKWRLRSPFCSTHVAFLPRRW
jgi:hypothetical protein